MHIVLFLCVSAYCSTWNGEGLLKYHPTTASVSDSDILLSSDSSQFNPNNDERWRWANRFRRKQRATERWLQPSASLSGHCVGRCWRNSLLHPQVTMTYPTVLTFKTLPSSGLILTDDESSGEEAWIILNRLAISNHYYKDLAREHHLSGPFQRFLCFFRSRCQGKQLQMVKIVLLGLVGATIHRSDNEWPTIWSKHNATAPNDFLSETCSLIFHRNHVWMRLFTATAVNMSHIVIYHKNHVGTRFRPIIIRLLTNIQLRRL